MLKPLTNNNIVEQKYSTMLEIKLTNKIKIFATAKGIGTAMCSMKLLRNNVVSYLKFLLFLIKLSFSDTTVIEGGRERKHI